MSIDKAYLTFLQLVNRNFTNDNIDVDKSRFVLLFNNIQNRYVEWVLEKRNEDDLRDVQSLLVLDKGLSKKSVKLNHSNFNLPNDYFNHSSVQVFASKNKCKNKKVAVHEVKNDNVEEYLTDCFNEPSFEYRDSFYTINSDCISIYQNDFSIDKVYLSYYRYPVQVDIEGYINLDETDSSNIDPEFSDRIVYKILLAMTKEFDAINDETNSYSISKDRLFSEI